jgi:predicted nucleic acid-binding protein
MSAVFLDTVGLLAVWDKSDQWHEPAAAAFSKLLAENVSLVTTDYVLLECGNASARRPYRNRVNALRQQMISGKLVYSPTDVEFENAWLAYDRGESDQAGIVDQVSFVVMRQLGLKLAFTNDWHFHVAGFETCW